MAKVVVVGSGIVGLAVADNLARRGDEVIVLEKDSTIAQHQTGRNSGVVHSGLYYAPGSQKALMCAAGVRSIRDFAEENGVDYRNTGKLVVATESSQEPQLQKLVDRANANGVPSRVVSGAEAREYEPYVRATKAMRVETTGIIDYPGICAAMKRRIEEAGGEIRFNTAFVSAATTGSGVVVKTSGEEIVADALVTCAGLYSDHVAKASGLVPEARIVPFRGEYFELSEDREYLVNGLIYPVPDPRFPFLGVHLTKMIKGGVHAGPNAVFALAREGYRWRDINVSELAESLAWPGLWRLAVKNMVPGVKEGVRSASRSVFAKSLSELVPGIRPEDLVPVDSGVRAQALKRDGSMVDDFLIQEAPRQVHVLNAPSPAATCSIEIAKHIVARVDELIA